MFATQEGEGEAVRVETKLYDEELGYGKSYPSRLSSKAGLEDLVDHATHWVYTAESDIDSYWDEVQSQGSRQEQRFALKQSARPMKSAGKALRNVDDMMYMADDLELPPDLKERVDELRSQMRPLSLRYEENRTRMPGLIARKLRLLKLRFF